MLHSQEGHKGVLIYARMDLQSHQVFYHHFKNKMWDLGLDQSRKHLVIVATRRTFLWPRISPWTGILWTSHGVDVRHRQWPHMCLNGPLIHCLSSFGLSFLFCDGEQDASTAEWGDSLSPISPPDVHRKQGKALSSSSVMVSMRWRSSGCSGKAQKSFRWNSWLGERPSRLIWTILLSCFSLYLTSIFCDVLTHLSIFSRFT